MRSFRRVVVTGVGAVTPVGNDAETTWRSLLEGRSGIGPIRSFDARGLPVRIAGEVKDFDPEAVMERKVARRTARFAQLAVAAGREALERSGLILTAETATGTGVILGTAGGLFASGYQERLLQERGAHRVDPLFVARAAAHMAAARVGRVLGLRGPNTTVNSACASGLDAIGQAFNWIRTGQADVVLAGGSESVMHPVGVASMAITGALSQRNHEPERASRPFDRERDGFVLAEGAGLLVLESEEHALRRGAPMLAEVLGTGWSFDAADDTAPDASGQALAMRRALDDAGLAPEAIQWVKAHGTSTPLNDRTETAALKQVFGGHARKLAISSVKSMIGHTASASGGVEAVAAVMALRDQTAPPTINYENPDPECDLDYVPNVARPMAIEALLANAFGLGGQNASLVLARYATGGPQADGRRPPE
ncbi:beta-ketoacyl-ACP synthase II [Limnochorda pilosa]|uniref:3-oxoacyl-[acyl-carrier-protein] synthase 2 n=1 Tax=Limnochorda pilosa TaxID=1555112 RepID=A0A0K2SQ49_LIMPI|nr:beta-ketoacyl-ACP synthase II [Limnochorda pilosa]BAS29216.1 3-oxoacyl-ACP synthase [Limnochorda pilosa]